MGENDETPVPDEKWQEAKRRAVIFFTEFPHRTLVKADVWKDLFPESKDPKRAKGLASIRELTQSRMLHHLQMAFSEDVRMGSYLW